MPGSESDTTDREPPKNQVFLSILNSTSANGAVLGGFAGSVLNLGTRAWALVGFSRVRHNAQQKHSLHKSKGRSSPQSADNTVSSFLLTQIATNPRAQVADAQV